ncbi:MAG TPA: PIN domain-containing protein [Patescibacteria group bacterium]|nr:PIN domain-containing protein [Patescibacteria group bacterium]
MISLDTNIVLRFLLGDVAEQTEKATELIENNMVYITDVIVIEIIYVLEKVYELSRKDICAVVTDFLNFTNVVHNPRFLLKTINLYENHPALSAVDCYACEEAKDYSNELVTLDKRLISQGGPHVRSLS